ncbi:unnamed protein product [Effrenium voratum]|nr:unnamed protein product [Effrenium voratum]
MSCPIAPSLLQLSAQSSSTQAHGSNGYEAPAPLLQFLLSPVAGTSFGSEPAALALSFCLVLAGGTLHGVAMALRKLFGEGHNEYWRQPRWWLGVLCDGVAGLMIWPAMPILAAQVLMPLATVVQLVVAYTLGLFFFQEQVSSWNHLGVLLAMVGVVGVSVSSPWRAADPRSICVDQWLQPHFMGALLGCGLVPLSAFALHWPPACCWAFLTALFEALQFLSSRTLADALLKWGTQEQSAAALLAALLLKGTCILCIMHCQQMGFQAELSRFVGIFMVATNLLTVVLSLAFFGDQVEASWSFLSSATSTLVGIWLLNCPLTLKRDSERGPDTPE